MACEVSVIIPCFKAHHTIERCVQSLLESYTPELDFEIVLEPDDGTDYSWVSKQFPRVRTCESSIASSGPGATRNRALKREVGEWITFVDADDYVDGGYLDEMIKTCRRAGAAVAVTNVVEAGSSIGSFGADKMTLDFIKWSASGISVRGMFPRNRCPVFKNTPSQDIFHLAEFLMMVNGEMQFSRAVYNLVLGSSTVTTSEIFKNAIEQSYDEYIQIIKAEYGGSPLCGRAIGFFEEKKKLNSLFRRHGGSSSFYRFVFDGLTSGYT